MEIFIITCPTKSCNAYFNTVGNVYSQTMVTFFPVSILHQGLADLVALIHARINARISRAILRICALDLLPQSGTCDSPHVLLTGDICVGCTCTLHEPTTLVLDSIAIRRCSPLL